VAAVAGVTPLLVSDSPAKSVTKMDPGAISARVAALPLRFDRNQGQWEPGVAFAAQGPGFSLLMTSEGPALVLHKRGLAVGRPGDPVVGKDAAAVVKMTVVGGRSVAPTASDPTAGVSHYLVGSDPRAWRRGVEGYSRIHYASVLPGVDLVFYGNDQRALEYDMVLAPGTDPNAVALRFDGSDASEVDARGALVLHTRAGVVEQPEPIAYQMSVADGRRVPVAARYRRRSDGTIGFALGRWDRTRALVIDPVIVYSTLLGGSAPAGTASAGASAVALDQAGNIYIAGDATATDLARGPAFQATNHGGLEDVFVSKLSADGSTLVYTTYLGGSQLDEALGIAVDATGQVSVAGITESNDFPTASAIQSSYLGVEDGFVAKLSADGSSLVYSTYLGGSGYTEGWAVANDAAGNSYAVGETNCADFPTTAATLQPTSGGGFDAFATKLSPSGSLIYSTFIGGTSGDGASSIAVDSVGNAFVAGSTDSVDFPGTGVVQPGLQGAADSFVVKLNADASAFIYSKFFGGSGNDWDYGIAIDAAGAAYLTGVTQSANFPTFSAFQPTYHAGIEDAFAAKLSPDGTALVYSTFLGGSQRDWGYGVAVDRAGSATFIGKTRSPDFPLVSAMQTYHGIPDDGWVAKLAANGSPVYSTFIGGSQGAAIGGVTIDGAGNAVLAGGTGSPDFPTTPLAYQRTFVGQGDALVMKLSTPATTAVPAGRGWSETLLALLLLVVSLRITASPGTRSGRRARPG
jgi:hypothetical protein